MDAQRVTGLQQQIVRTIVDAAPRGWQHLEHHLVIVGGYGVGGPAVIQDGVRELLPEADMAGIHGMDLQEAMFEPGKGTWLSMRCVIDPPGEYQFSFNYDEPVEFDEHEEILDSSWVREFKSHPRPWVLIPEWNYVRQAFTEAEWAEQVAEFERTGRHGDGPEPSAPEAKTTGLRRWLEVTESLRGDASAERPGASPESIADLESGLGLTLDESHRAYLESQDGWEPTGRASTLAGTLKIAPVRSLLSAPRTYLGPSLEEVTGPDTVQDLLEAGIAQGSYLVVAADLFLGGSYLMPIREGRVGPEVVLLLGWVEEDTFVGGTFPGFSEFLEHQADEAAATAKRAEAEEAHAERVRRLWQVEPTISAQGLSGDGAAIASGLTRVLTSIEKAEPVGPWTIPMRRWDGSASDLHRVMNEATRVLPDGTKRLYVPMRADLATGASWQVSVTMSLPSGPEDGVFLLRRSKAVEDEPSGLDIEALVLEAAQALSPTIVTAASTHSNQTASHLGISSPAGYRIWLRSDQLGQGWRFVDSGDFSVTAVGEGALITAPDQLGAEQVVPLSHELVTRLTSDHAESDAQQSGGRLKRWIRSRRR